MTHHIVNQLYPNTKYKGKKNCDAITLHFIMFTVKKIDESSGKY